MGHGGIRVGYNPGIIADTEGPSYDTSHEIRASESGISLPGCRVLIRKFYCTESGIQLIRFQQQ